MDESEHVSVAMNKRQRRIIIGTCLFFGAVILFGVYQRLHGILLLRSMLANLKKAGEEMDYRKFPIHVPDPTNNMVPPLLALSNRLHAVDDILRSAPNISSLEDGFLISPFDESEWPYITPYAAGANEATNTWDNFIVEFTPHMGLTVELLNALNRTDYYSGYDPEDGFHVLPMESYMNARSVERTLKTACLIHLRNSDTNAAHQCIVSIQNLVAGMKNEPLLITQMIRHAITLGSFHLTWHALDQLTWSDAQMLEWQTFWKAQQHGADFLNACRMERALNLERVHRLAGRSGSTIRQQREWDATGNIEPGNIRYYLTVPMWRLIWNEQDCGRMLRYWTHQIDATKTALDSGWKNAVTMVSTHAPPPTQRWYDEYRFILESGDMFMDPMSNVKRTLQMETLQSLAITGIAINRYIGKHGIPPATLTDMNPDFLAEVPVDPYDRKPLRYFTVGDEWVLYSVGENIDDDGGEVEIGAPGKPVKSIFDGADIVWPRPALPNQTEEIQNN